MKNPRLEEPGAKGGVVIEMARRAGAALCGYAGASTWMLTLRTMSLTIAR